MITILVIVVAVFVALHDNNIGDNNDNDNDYNNRDGSSWNCLFVLCVRLCFSWRAHVQLRAATRQQRPPPPPQRAASAVRWLGRRRGCQLLFCFVLFG